MATYYVRKTGNDGNAGTSAGAAWLTIGKALGAAGIASGDTVWVGAGVYREAVTVAMTSATAETLVIADVDGKNTGDAGEVRWTGYGVNDSTVPALASPLILAGRDFLTFRNFVLQAGTSVVVDSSTTAGSTDIKFEDCTFIGGSGSAHLITHAGIVDTAFNWTIDRCRFFGWANQNNINIAPPTSASADYDVNFLIRNCLFVGNSVHIRLAPSGALSFKPGGVDILNCTFGFGTQAFNTSNANTSTSIPCTMNNCLLFGQTTTCLNCSTTGQLVEDYNIIFASTARSNVTAGANSLVTGARGLLLHIGQELHQAKLHRPAFMPTADSKLLGFGSTGAPSVDILNRVRPSGGASTSNAAGCFERHDIAAKEATVTDSGNGVKITGPGDQDIRIPVTAASTTITIKGRYDTNHAATNKPQAILLANGEIGVTTETKTMTAAVDTWETLTFAAQTPSAAGWVTLRLVSRSAAGNGLNYWDTLTVS